MPFIMLLLLQYLSVDSWVIHLLCCSPDGVFLIFRHQLLHEFLYLTVTNPLTVSDLYTPESSCTCPSTSESLIYGLGVITQQKTYLVAKSRTKTPVWILCLSVCCSPCSQGTRDVSLSSTCSHSIFSILAGS